MILTIASSSTPALRCLPSSVRSIVVSSTRPCIVYSSESFGSTALVIVSTFPRAWIMLPHEDSLPCLEHSHYSFSILVSISATVFSFSFRVLVALRRVEMRSCKRALSASRALRNFSALSASINRILSKSFLPLNTLSRQAFVCIFQFSCTLLNPLNKLPSNVSYFCCNKDS